MIRRILAQLSLWWQRFAMWQTDATPYPKPELVYTDAIGIGWRETPNWQDADQPDKGQHDSWKIDLRIFIWRASRGESHTPRQLSTQETNLLGIGVMGTVAVPVLYPVGQQLAEACRRLGYAALAEAAVGDLFPDASEREAIVLAVYEKHEKHVAIEAQRRWDHAQDVLKWWDPVRLGGPYSYAAREDTMALLTLGPLTPVAQAAPLTPLIETLTDEPAASPLDYTNPRPR